MYSTALTVKRRHGHYSSGIFHPTDMSPDSIVPQINLLEHTLLDTGRSHIRSSVRRRTNGENFQI